MKRLTIHVNAIAICSMLLLLCACDTGPKSSAGFRLPDGEASIGEQQFVALGCNDCHTVKGTTIPASEAPAATMVQLGGSVSRIKTYGELVSSVINPSHKITSRYAKEQVSQNGASLMRRYNETMTVQQLVDLVAFLQSTYQVVVPQYDYIHYGP